MKRCGACKLRKEYDKFYSNKSTPDGYSWQCKLCTDLYAKTARIGKYGITKDQFAILLYEQDNRCCICQSIFDITNIPVIDHDHTCCPTKPMSGGVLFTRCGKCIRGLLCRSCNAGLGMFSDNIERLNSAIYYLQEHEPVRLVDEVSLNVYTIPVEYNEG